MMCQTKNRFRSNSGTISVESSRRVLFIVNVHRGYKCSGQTHMECHRLDYKNNFLGQTYYSAAVMSGKHSGVQAKIREHAKFYIHVHLHTVPSYCQLMQSTLSERQRN